MVAIDNMEAAQLLLEQHKWRSAVSRAYYAAFSAAHAIGRHAGEQPRPVMGTWKHASITSVLYASLRRLAGAKSPLPWLLVSYLERVRDHRGFADYQPATRLDGQTARDVVHEAAQIASCARRMINA